MKSHESRCCLARFVSVVLLGLLLPWPAMAQSDYYVRPGAAAAGKGLSAKDAFGTIEQARDAIRARSDASIKGDITVHLLPGTYFLKSRSPSTTATRGATATR
jgi:hypothetical protein